MKRAWMAVSLIVALTMITVMPTLAQGYGQGIGAGRGRGAGAQWQAQNRPRPGNGPYLGNGQRFRLRDGSCLYGGVTGAQRGPGRGQGLGLGPGGGRRDGSGPNPYCPIRNR